MRHWRNGEDKWNKLHWSIRFILKFNHRFILKTLKLHNHRHNSWNFPNLIYLYLVHFQVNSQLLWSQYTNISNKIWLGWIIWKVEENTNETKLYAQYCCIIKNSTESVIEIIFYNLSNNFTICFDILCFGIWGISF